MWNRVAAAACVCLLSLLICGITGAAARAAGCSEELPPNYLWQEQDATSDPEDAGVQPSGTDIENMSATTYATSEEDCVHVVMRLTDIEGATGSYVYQVGFTYETESFASAADITWAHGEAVSVESTGRGGGRVGDAFWFPEERSLMFTIPGSVVGGIRYGDTFESFSGSVGQSLGPSAWIGSYDAMFQTVPWEWQPLATPPQPPVTTTPPAADAPAAPILLIVSALVLVTVQSRTSRLSGP